MHYHIVITFFLIFVDNLLLYTTTGSKPVIHDIKRYFR